MAGGTFGPQQRFGPGGTFGSQQGLITQDDFDRVRESFKTLLLEAPLLT